MTLSKQTICECGHPLAEHAGCDSIIEHDGRVGFFGQCQHRVPGARYPCECNAFGAARICSGCGGDGIAYEVSDRRRQLARRELKLSRQSGDTERAGKRPLPPSRCVTECHGVRPVARPFIDCIDKLRHLWGIGYELDHDIHTVIAHQQAVGKHGEPDWFPLERPETPDDLPGLVHAAWGIWPHEMCQRCYGSGRATAQRIEPVEIEGVAKSC